MLHYSLESAFAKHCPRIHTRLRTIHEAHEKFRHLVTQYSDTKQVFFAHALEIHRAQEQYQQRLQEYHSIFPFVPDVLYPDSIIRALDSTRRCTTQGSHECRIFTIALEVWKPGMVWYDTQQALWPFLQDHYNRVKEFPDRFYVGENEMMAKMLFSDQFREWNVGNVEYHNIVERTKTLLRVSLERVAEEDLQHMTTRTLDAKINREQFRKVLDSVICARILFPDFDIHDFFEEYDDLFFITARRFFDESNLERETGDWADYVHVLAVRRLLSNEYELTKGMWNEIQQHMKMLHKHHLLTTYAEILFYIKILTASEIRIDQEHVVFQTKNA